MSTAPPAPAVGAVLMAAGAGRRLGGVPKALLRRDGETLLLRQLRLLQLAGAGPIAVVLGHHAAQLAAVLQQQRSQGALEQVGWVTNPAPDDGPATSLRCGLAALPPGLATVLVALADQPLLEDGDIQAVLDAWRTRPPGTALVVPEHSGQPGHPIAFGAQLRSAILQAPASQGVREWRRSHPQQVHALPAAHARYTTDVDTPEDLQRLRSACGVRLELPHPAAA